MSKPKVQHQIIPQLPDDTGVHMDVVDGKLVIIPGPAETKTPVVYETPDDLPTVELEWS